MARRDVDDGEELLRPRAGGRGKLALLLGVGLTVGVLLLCLIGLARSGREPADAPVAGANNKTPSQGGTSVPPAPQAPATPPGPPTEPELSDPSPPDPRPATPRPVVPAPPKPAEPEPVVVRANGVTLTTYSLKRKDRLGEWVPDKGFAIFAADVEIVSAAAAELKYGPRVFKLKDKQGRESAATLRKFDGALTTGTLKRGERVRGVVAFSARAADGLTLSLSAAGWKEPLVAKLTD